ncbi:MAG TPA: DUF4349 domain-containing protein [Actinomycetota bacterium]|nr:DUF4349 domain-containing protein [Actinomycetota bacterium]
MRRASALILLAALLMAPACGGGEGDSSAAIGLNDPIGAPEEDPTSAPSLAEDPSVIKTASVQMDVSRPDLNAAAQSVVDLATTDAVGGFLVSSVLDTNDGFGMAQVVVKVPSPVFEDVVSGLEDVGNITRQELEGEDLSGSALAVHARLRETRARFGSLMRRIQRSDDGIVRAELRTALRDVRGNLTRLENDESHIQRVTSFSTIDVAIVGKQPPAPPQKPALERSIETAMNIMVSIASGVILAAGVVVPLALIAVVIYLIWRSFVRRLRLPPATSRP